MKVDFGGFAHLWPTVHCLITDLTLGLPLPRHRSECASYIVFQAGFIIEHRGNFFLLKNYTIIKGGYKITDLSRGGGSTPIPAENVK